MTENTQLLHKGNTAVWLVSRLTGFSKPENVTLNIYK